MRSSPPSRSLTAPRPPDQLFTEDTLNLIHTVARPRTMQPSAKRIQGQYNPEVVHSRSRRRGN